MKNTRRFLAAVMALAMISAMAPISASARGGEGEGEPAGTSLTENGASADTNVKYSVDPSYTVVIPADVTLSDDKDVTADIKLDKPETFKLAKGAKLSVKIESEKFEVTNSGDSVTYTVKSGDNVLAKGDTAAEFAEGNTGAKTLTFPKMDNKAKYAGEYTGTLTFTIAVEAAPTTVDVTGISLDKPTLGLTAGGDTATLTATVSPDTATDKTVTWTSSDTSVATVADGVVIPVAAGTATITATAGGKTATCTVTVEPATVAVTGVSLNKTSIVLLTNGQNTETLTATVKPDDATDKTVTWTSSDESVATVDQNGKVTAIATGTATITAKAGDKTASCTVFVNKVTITNSDYPFKDNDNTNFDKIDTGLVTVTFDNKGDWCGNYHNKDGWFFYGDDATVTVTPSKPNMEIKKVVFYTKNGSAELTKAPFTVYSYGYYMYTAPNEGGTCFNDWGVNKIEVYFN